MSYLEIYNESINDLLGSCKRNLELKSTNDGAYVENVTQFSVISLEDFKKILA